MEEVDVQFITPVPAVKFSLENYFRKSKRIKLTGRSIDNFDAIFNKEDRLSVNRLFSYRSRKILMIDDGTTDYSESELIKKILTSAFKGINKILFTSSLDRMRIEYYLSSGVDGVISTHDSLETIKECIENVAYEKKYVSKFIKSACTIDENFIHCYPELSSREKQVISLRIEGKTNAEIAGQLHLGTKTIESILHSAKVKNNMKHIGEVVLKYARNGITPLIPLLINLADSLQ